jgi:putative nucleotidyltransferase with HDIG domain
MDRKQRLRRITEKIIGLPTLPTIVTQLIALVGDPRSSARDVAKLISTDQALTAKILKVANSAFYGFPRKIATVQLAIVVLGFEAVKNLGLSVAVLKRFSSGADHELFDRQRFWEHAISCGVAARMLARKYDIRVGDEAFVGGILHDIGKLILIEYFFDEFAEALELAEAEEISIVEAEEQVLGVTHAEVGGWLAEKWNLPPSLVETIAYHHRTDQLESPEPSVLLIHLADNLVRHLGIGGHGDRQGARLDAAVSARFKGDDELTDEEFLNVLSEGFREEMDKAEIFRDLDPAFWGETG